LDRSENNISRQGIGGWIGREGNTDFATKKLFGEKAEIDGAHLLGALKRWTPNRKRNAFEGTGSDFCDAIPSNTLSQFASFLARQA
jgi:hypothetical protein